MHNKKPEAIDYTVGLKFQPLDLEANAVVVDKADVASVDLQKVQTGETLHHYNQCYQGKHSKFERHHH